MSKFKIELFCFVKKIKWRAWAVPLKRDIYRLDFICNIFLSRDFLPIYNLEIAVLGAGGGGKRIEGFAHLPEKNL